MTGTLRLSFDASAVPARPVGAGRYTIDLARALGTLDDADAGKVDLSVWCRAGDDARLGTLIGGSPRLLPRAPRGRAQRLIWEQARLGRLVDALGVDVHHSPHYTLPERSRTPVVVTIHDLTFLEHPEWHERSKVPVFRRAIRIAARHAAVVVCVSRSTADRLVELTRPVGQVVVVPHGVDQELFHPATATDEESDDKALRQAGVDRPYVLFVGTQEPRKAVPDLVRAFDRVADKHEDLSLVLAGGRGWGVTAVDEAVAAATHKNRVIRTGYVEDELVGVLMRRAAAVAYPAYEEGFGLPALEALASGTPLVTTRGSAMAEVAGDAASLVAPGDTGALAEALEEAVVRGPEVLGRIAAGRLVAASHTWEASARRHLEAYRMAEESGSP
jgi:glycosyltransferase involved in cell wall biosynthesis